MADSLIRRDEPLPADAELTALVTLYTTVLVADYLDDGETTITLDELCRRIGGEYDLHTKRWYVSPDKLYSHLRQTEQLHVDTVDWEPTRVIGEQLGARFERTWEVTRRRDGNEQRVGSATYITFAEATSRQVA